MNITANRDGVYMKKPRDFMYGFSKVLIPSFIRNENATKHYFGGHYYINSTLDILENSVKMKCILYGVDKEE